MAHFGNDFDRLFYEAALSRLGIDAPAVPWLDSSIDVKYPAHIKTRNLRHLASEHSFLNPFSHRAVFDVLTMLKVASCYDLDAIIARANEPTLFVEAIVSFQEKDKAKDRGYRWFAGSQTARKCWWKQFKASDYEIERETCGFDTFILPGAPE
jgi:DNA polymerase-3 subunit epsilon